MAKKMAGVQENLIAYALGAIALYVFIIKPITDKLGLTKSAAEVQNDAEINNPGSAFNPLYWQTTPANKVYNLLGTGDGVNSANNYAATIRASFSSYQDNEDQVMNVFRQLKSKAQVSQVAWVFQNLYGADLLSWLRGGSWPDDRLDEEELNQVIQIVNALPNY